MDNTPEAFVARVAEATARRRHPILIATCRECDTIEGPFDAEGLCVLCADDARISA